MMRIVAAWLLLTFLVSVPVYAQESPGAEPGESKEAAESSEDKNSEEVKELSLEERMAVLEKKLKDLGTSRVGDTGILKKLRVGFELELEWIYAQRDRVVPARRGQLDKFTIGVNAEFDRHFSLVAQGRFEADEAWVKTAYGQLDNLPFSQRIRFGLDERIFKPTRRTESYPLIGSAFWRAHDFGISYRIRIPDSKNSDSYTYMKASVANGLTLDPREPGEQEQYYIVSDRKPGSAADLGENEEYSLALGARLGKGKKRWLDISLFGLVSRLDDSDAAFLNLHINSVDTTLGTARRGDSKWRRGGALTVRYAGFFFQGMYLKARDSELFHEGYYIQPSYRLDIRHKWLRSAELVLRTGRLIMDMDKSIAQPMSWDRDELTVAALLEIRKGVVLKLEYTVYGEEPGKGNRAVKNNEFVFQLELRF
jgi:hypothetical protein